MKRLLIAAVLSIITLAHAQDTPKVLLFMRGGSAALEFMLKSEVLVMKDALQRSGFRVVVATLDGQGFSAGSVAVKADIKLAGAKMADYEGFILPCMMVASYPEPEVSKEAIHLVKEAVATGKPVAAQTGSLVVMEMFAETLMTIVGGEISQLFRSRSGDLRRDYFDRIYAKTASLFEVATAAAAVLSGAPASQVASAKTVGYNLGVAFQIVDDVLDFVGNQEEVGKPVASDLRQGLLTLPALLAIDSRPVDDDFIDAILQRRLDPSVLEDLIWQVRTSDAIARSLDEARSYVRLAQDSLAALPDCRERDALSELAAYIVQRTL